MGSDTIILTGWGAIFLGGIAWIRAVRLLDQKRKWHRLEDDEDEN